MGVSRNFVSRLIAALVAAIIAVVLLSVLALAIDVFLMMFGGVLLGIFLLALRDGLVRIMPLTPRWSLIIVIVALLALVFGVGVLIAPQLSEQLDDLADRLPRFVQQASDFLARHHWGRLLLEETEENDVVGSVSHGLGSIVLFTVEGFVYLIGLIVVGLFIAIDPQRYANGMVVLMPIAARARARQILAEMGVLLRWFLVARAISMLLVGTTTAIALALLGIPLALLLAVIAGLLTFVPYLGPIAAGVPIGVVALLEGPDMAIYALLVYTIIQWIEGYIFDPLILQRMVRLPPVVTVVAQFLGGALLGVLGVVVATPLVAAAQVLVRRAYREDLLGDRPHGAHPARAP